MARPTPELLTMTGFILQIFLYGGYVVLFAFAAAFLTVKRRTNRTNWFMLVVSCTLFAASTAYVIVMVRGIVLSFVMIPAQTGKAIVLAQGKVDSIPNNVLVAIIVVLSDLVLVHRAWIV